MDVWSLVTAEPALAEDGPHLSGQLDRLCRAAARALPTWAAGVSVVSADGDPAVVAASGTRAREVEQLQLTLGEGPCQEAYGTGRAVLVPDLSAAVTRWPGYAPAALQHGVHAVWAFPLQVGASRLGALDLYRESIGPLSGQALEHAFGFAEAAMTALLDSQDHNGDVLGGPLVVHQAQGMVHVQLGVSLDEALTRLRAHAWAQDRSLSDVAADVVARRLELESDL